MMKVQMSDVNGQLILQVEGRLSGAFVPELEKCWQAAVAHQPDRKISVDLKNVTCIDGAGRDLLRWMHTSGVSFPRAGMATQDILDQITDRPDCK